jgi:hypothetical protein
MGNSKNPSESEDSRQIFFEYRRSDFFRSITIDGVNGGLSPRGKINAYLYSENRALPDRTTLTVTPSGEAKEQSDQRDTEALGTREVEANLIIDPSTAVSLAQWFAEQAAIAARNGLIEEELLEQAGIDVDVPEDAVDESENA